MTSEQLLIFLCSQVLKDHEDTRTVPYDDSLDHCTIGVGHLIHKGPCTPEEKKKLYPISRINSMLGQDVRVAIKDAKSWLGEKFFDEMPFVCQIAFTCMSFQLGLSTILTFRESREAIMKKEVIQICSGLRASKWAKQTPKRVEFICAMLKESEWAIKN